VAPPERPALSFKALAIHDKENGQSESMESRSLTQTTVASVTSSAIEQLPSTTNDMHILIVEDNLINQTVLRRQITKAGLTCDGAFC
jgi:CheY-like chemotaxis protein